MTRLETLSTVRVAVENHYSGEAQEPGKYHRAWTHKLLGRRSPVLSLGGPEWNAGSQACHLQRVTRWLKAQCLSGLHWPWGDAAGTAAHQPSCSSRASSASPELPCFLFQ